MDFACPGVSGASSETPASLDTSTATGRTPVHIGSLHRDLQRLGVGQDQVWAMRKAAERTLSGPSRSQQLLAAKKQFVALQGLLHHGHYLRRLDLQRSASKPGTGAQWGCRVCFRTWGSFSALKTHLENKGTCDGAGHRETHLRSLAWREKWQWATKWERQVFREGLGMTKAEARRLSQRLVWTSSPRSFVRGGRRAGSCTRKTTSSSSDRPAMGTTRRRADRFSTSAAGPYEWPCTLCSAVFVADSKPSLGRQRDNHITRFHRGADRSLFTTINGTMGACRRYRVGTGCRRDRSGHWLWTCDVCQNTLKGASQTFLRGLRYHHIQTVHPGACGSEFKTIHGNPGRRTQFEENGQLRNLLLEDPAKRRAFADDRKSQVVREGVERHPGPSSSGAASGDLSLDHCLLEDPGKLHAYRDDRKDQLVREGIERQPGPGEVVHKDFRARLFSCNANGYANSYQALDLAADKKPHFIMLQEVNSDGPRGQKLIAHCHRLGYRAWVALRPSTGSVTYGGILIAARRDVRCHFVTKEVGNTFEAIALDAEGFFLTAVWQRPGTTSDSSFATWCGPLLAAATRRQALWLCMGDFNEEPDSHPMLGSPDGCDFQAPRSDGGQLIPTRWQGDRCIDWLMVSEHGIQSSVWTDEAFISDHKAIWADVTVPCGLHRAREYQVAIRFQRPLEVAESSWKKALAQALQGFEDRDLGNAEAEWNYLNQELEQGFGKAYQSLGCSPPEGRRARRKGTEVQWFAEGAASKRWDKRGSFLQRRLAKWLGRAKEAQRQRALGRVNHGLEGRLLDSWPKEVPRVMGSDGFLSLDRAVEQCGLALEEERRRQRDTSLRRWHADMAQEGKAASKWLKNRPFLSAQGVVTEDAEGHVHRTFDVMEAFDILLGKWREIWRRDDTVPEMDQAEDGVLARPGRAPSQNWQLRASDLYASAQRRKGCSGSFDGWEGDELAMLPLAFWEQFLPMLNRWTRRGHFPRAMQCYRQVFIPKGNLNEGDTNPSDLRPISIGCCFSRIISGAMLQHSGCQAWISQIVPDQMHGAMTGRSIEAGIVDLLELWKHDDSVLLSLDMAKGFDYANVEHSLAVLQHYGFCGAWLTYLKAVWKSQRRHSQLGPYVTEEPEIVRRSLPQGDPLAPLAFCLLLQQEWESWCRFLGLRENSGKVAFVARALRDQKQLQELVEDPSRGRHFTLESRRTRACEVLQRLTRTPLALKLKERLFVSRCVSVGAWGLWLKGFRNSYDFGSKVKSLLEGHRSASRDLWELLQGHVVNLGFVGLTRSLAALARGLAYWQLRGRPLSGGMWADTAGASLEDLGFSYTRGRWRHLQAGSFEWPEAWRAQRWDRFRMASRRDSASMQHLQFDALLVKRACQAFGKANADGRAVLSGGAHSIAAYHAIQGQDPAEVDRCPYCNEAGMPHWEHLAWDCSFFANGRPACPADERAARLGWPVTGDPHVDGIRLRHLCFVRDRVRRDFGRLRIVPGSSTEL
ncbi:unnamed protein product [Symbiodinium sp. CCMP2592]|nr:unnamed protein product [Symbiodinium sp. CCMP2592]